MKYNQIALECLDIINRDSDYYELEKQSLEWILKKYVNIRNYKRFFSELSDDTIKYLIDINLLAIELYAEKAYQLYCKIQKRI